MGGELSRSSSSHPSRPAAREKKAAGWKYGSEKDPEKKEHPCFLPYEELTDAQKAKDAIFVAVVRVVGKALHLW